MFYVPTLLNISIFAYITLHKCRYIHSCTEALLTYIGTHVKSNVQSVNQAMT
jgi:hypothetical protein